MKVEISLMAIIGVAVGYYVTRHYIIKGSAY